MKEDSWIECIQKIITDFFFIEINLSILTQKSVARGNDVN